MIIDIVTTIIVIIHVYIVANTIVFIIGQHILLTKYGDWVHCKRMGQVIGPKSLRAN